MDEPAPVPPLRDGALVTADQDILTADVVIIGSGMGGGTLAWALKDTGLDVLIVERGQFLPREPENSQPDHVFIKKRYVTSKPWYDAKTGQPFQPGVYYWVGGNTKMYGACLPRFRRSDFEEVNHHDGISPAWPFSYDDLEPCYAQAEELFEVHGAVGEDPTEPEHSTPYPYPPLSHEPAVERLAVRLRRQGLHPFHMANGMHLPSMAERRADATSDGSPSPTGAKSDAENRAVRPALESPTVRLLLGAYVRRLHTSPDGHTVTAAEAQIGDRTVRIEAKTFVVAGGAVNSAALLLRSVSDQHPAGTRQLLRPAGSQLHGPQQHLLHGRQPGPSQRQPPGRRPSASTTGTRPDPTPRTRSATCRCSASSGLRWSRPPDPGRRCGRSSWSPTAASTSTSPPRICPGRTTGSPSTATRS